MTPRTPTPEDSFGIWLSYFIDRSEWSGARLAKRIGVNPTTLMRWRRDETLPRDRAQVEALARALHLTEQQEESLFSAARRWYETRTHPSYSPPRSSPSFIPPPPAILSGTHTFIVGRTTEADAIQEMVNMRHPRRVVNVHGIGGIGKTVLRVRLTGRFIRQQTPVAVVDAERDHLSVVQVLSDWSEMLAQNGQGAAALSDFRQAGLDYQLIERLLYEQRGVAGLFDTIGTIRHPDALNAYLREQGRQLSARAQEVVQNRFALERYLRKAEETLTGAFVAGLAELETHTCPVLIVDTYEAAEALLDRWLTRTLVPLLATQRSALLLFGRNRLPDVNFTWNDLEDVSGEYALPELGKEDVLTYFAHYGLTDPSRQEAIYAVTGGYPLLLVLVRQLAQQVGGWDEVGTLTSDVDRDRLATRLLERILREQRVETVREFLEKGVISAWFTPEIIGVVLGAAPQEARRIYDQLATHSFVEPHPRGLKFHDKIKELLDVRLRRTDRAGYDAIHTRLIEYFADRAARPERQE